MDNKSATISQSRGMRLTYGRSRDHALVTDADLYRHTYLAIVGHHHCSQLVH
ncbi:MAG: hypothetical protein GY850_41565 [bacterium]|nr:hypothetical protein [bacterium]